MRIRRRISLVGILLGVAFGALPAWAGLFHHHYTAAQLDLKIGQQKNPVKKAELQMRLARLILQQGIESYDQNHFKAGKAFLGRYLTEAQASWETLKSSRRNAVRQPEGFKQLDIAFTANDRLLGDLRRRIAYPESEAIKKIQEESRAVHGQVLDALFPGLHMRHSARPAPRPSHASSHRAGVSR